MIVDNIEKNKNGIKILTYIFNFFVEHSEEVELTGGYLSAKNICKIK